MTSENGWKPKLWKWTNWQWMNPTSFHHEAKFAIFHDQEYHTLESDAGLILRWTNRGIWDVRDLERLTGMERIEIVRILRELEAKE